ncbi:B-cell differentiation antigen CD72 [Rhinatrema bivittatum]|uniref:B-cell differentiation antigen CD72 n=1 Tax=Rhinatrema bivittatum TaxID=194408 RepID=UPI001126499E|nr:B-cell differentiation antigen CD72 [Rhinatrema bivittatum]
MAEAVTYAELRFARPPARKPKPYTSEPALAAAYCEEDRDGELTYANISISRASLGTRRWPQVAGACLSWLTQHTRIILMVLCLCLLVTTMGLVGKLFQVSQHLKESRDHNQQLSSEHENVSSSLALGLSRKAMALMHTEQKLRASELQLGQTSDELQAARQELNQSQQQLMEMAERLRMTKENLGETQQILSVSKEALTEKGNALRETQETLSRTKNTLAAAQWKQRETEGSLQATQNKLRGTESTLLTTQRKLTENENDLRETRTSLITEKDKRTQTEAALANVKEKWSRADKCVLDTCSQRSSGSQRSSESFDYCPSAWILLNGNCYFFSETESTRIESDSYCTSQDSRLVTIKDNNPELKDYVKSKKKAYWIGFSRKDRSTGWTWSDGSKVNPQYYSAGNCATMDDGLTIRYCNRYFPWICEKVPFECAFSSEILRCFVEKLKS